jgi:hypothetical protein
VSCHLPVAIADRIGRMDWCDRTTEFPDQPLRSIDLMAFLRGVRCGRVLIKRGLLDETLVVAFGKMGRRQRRIPPGAATTGAIVFHASFAGAGIVAASSTARPMHTQPIRNRMRSHLRYYLAKTNYWALGIDPELMIPDREGCPSPIVESGKPLTELFG